MSTCREAVRPIYQLLGADDERLAFHNHATGHRPPASANRIAYEWLRRLAVKLKNDHLAQNQCI